jgi:hypothetical protein
MRHKRALKRLVNKLGGRKPYQDVDLDKPNDDEGDDGHSGEYRNDISTTEEGHHTED